MNNTVSIKDYDKIQFINEEKNLFSFHFQRVFADLFRLALQSLRSLLSIFG